MRETVSIRASETIDVPAEVLFEKIADYRSAQRLIDGLDSMVPRGSVTSGKGARFVAVMRVGPRTFRATIEITDYEAPHRLTWSSAGREAQALRFEFTEQATVGGSTTRVTLEVSYERPGGVAGILAAPVVERTVRTRVHSTLERLRADVA
jgi:uncharacterized membrane protein